MAWTVDQASIGNSGTASNASFTTTATVAVGAWIFIYAAHFGATAIASCSGGSLTYSLVDQHVNGSVRVGLFRAFAPAGLATGTAITFVGFNGNQHIAGCSFLGGDASSTVGTPGHAAAATAAHSVTATTHVNNALEIQCLHVNSAATANTPDANSLELQDFSAGGTAQRGVMQYRLPGVAGAYALGGTCGAATWASLAVSFSPTVAVAANPRRRQFVPAMRASTY